MAAERRLVPGRAPWSWVTRCFNFAFLAASFGFRARERSASLKDSLSSDQLTRLWQSVSETGPADRRAGVSCAPSQSAAEPSLESLYVKCIHGPTASVQRALCCCQRRYCFASVLAPTQGHSGIASHHALETSCECRILAVSFSRWCSRCNTLDLALPSTAGAPASQL